MRKLFFLCILLVLLINLSGVNAAQKTPSIVISNLTITIFENKDALFNWTTTVKIDDNIIGNFHNMGIPVNEKIIHSSVIVKSNKGTLKHSIGDGYIHIFSESDISFGKNDPLIINSQYKEKDFLKYNNQTNLYRLFQPFKQYDITHIPKYYDLDVKIIFPFNLYPDIEKSYMPFFCFPNNELANNENFSVDLIQDTPPIIRYKKNLNKEEDYLDIDLFFELLPSPPRMQFDITEELNLVTGEYKTTTRAINLYDHELCLIIDKKEGDFKLEIQDCDTPYNKISIPNFYYLKQNETSEDFTDGGHIDIHHCGDSVFDNLYPFDCYKYIKKLPIETKFHPKKLQKDMNINYILNIHNSKGYVVDKKSFYLSILPELMTLPNYPGYGCQVFRHLDYSTLDKIVYAEKYSAKLNTKIFQPTTRSLLNYEILVRRSPIRIWLQMIYAILGPIALFFLISKIENTKKLSQYLLTSFTSIYSLIILSINLGATPEEAIIKSVPLYLMVIILLIMLLKLRIKKLKKHIKGLFISVPEE